MAKLIGLFCDQLQAEGIPFELISGSRQAHFTVLIAPQDRLKAQVILKKAVKNGGWDRLYQSKHFRLWQSLTPIWAYQVLSISGDKGLFIHLSTAHYRYFIPVQVAGTDGLKTRCLRLAQFWLYFTEQLCFPRGSWHRFSEPRYWQTQANFQTWSLHLIYSHWVEDVVVIPPRDWGWPWIYAGLAYFRGAMVVQVSAKTVLPFSKKGALERHFGRQVRLR